LSYDTAPSPGDILSVEAIYDDGAATVFLVGEFDLSGAAQFWAAVSEALATRPPSVTVEARGLRFIDLSGLTALIRARHAAHEAGVPFRVSEPSPPLRRIAAVAGITDLLPPE
jgi:anti-sigma B factor antagonist